MPFGLDAIVDAVMAGTAIYVTDGSYNCGIRADLDGAGWLIYCSARKKIIYKGSACEVNNHTGSYCGELLGLLALHVLVLAVTEFYNIGDQELGLVACNNLGG